MTDLISAITDHFPSMLHEVCLCAPPSDGSLDQPGLVDDHLGSGLSRCGTFCAQNGNNRLFLIRKFFFRLCQIVNDFHVDVGLGNSSGLIFRFAFHLNCFCKDCDRNLLRGYCSDIKSHRGVDPVKPLTADAFLLQCILQFSDALSGTDHAEICRLPLLCQGPQTDTIVTMASG